MSVVLLSPFWTIQWDTYRESITLPFLCTLELCAFLFPPSKDQCKYTLNRFKEIAIKMGKKKKNLYASCTHTYSFYKGISIRTLLLFIGIASIR